MTQKYTANVSHQAFSSMGLILSRDMQHMFYCNMCITPLLDRPDYFAPKRYVQRQAQVEKHSRRRPSADTAPRWAFQASPGKLPCWAPTVRHTLYFMCLQHNISRICRFVGCYMLLATLSATAAAVLHAGNIGSSLILIICYLHLDIVAPTFNATVNAAEVIQPWY